MFFYVYQSPIAGNLARKISSASSLSSMEESYFLQASLDFSETSSERRHTGEVTMNPYYVKSMTPNVYEASLRQKEGELASYMSRLVWFLLKFLMGLIFTNSGLCYNYINER